MFCILIVSECVWICQNIIWLKQKHLRKPQWSNSNYGTQNKWKMGENCLIKLTANKTCPVLIVPALLDYCFSFSVNKTNLVHADNNLASSGRKKLGLLIAIPRWWQRNIAESKTVRPGKGLTCYDCCYYLAQSDTAADIIRVENTPPR